MTKQEVTLEDQVSVKIMFSISRIADSLLSYFALFVRGCLHLPVYVLYLDAEPVAVLRASPEASKTDCVPACALRGQYLGSYLLIAGQ